ncbi:MAG: redoxin domain-containing protein [Myxococcales bacterium]|nr:MAG: redoxin domain-containing protein [Myxococcales bacterium]
MQKAIQPLLYGLLLSLWIAPYAAHADNTKKSDGNKGTASAQVGRKAPAIELSDLSKKGHKLSDYSGKIVVLEWFNPECPFVKFAHSQGPLKDLAKQLAGEDLVWLAINSSAPGRQGHGIEKNQIAKAKFKMNYPILMDESGQTGRSYGAKTTPHMFIINAKGILVYKGALDNAPLGTIYGKKHINYIKDAVTALRSNKAIEQAQTNAYGCSVKYSR